MGDFGFSFRFAVSIFIRDSWHWVTRSHWWPEQHLFWSKYFISSCLLLLSGHTECFSRHFVAQRTAAMLQLFLAFFFQLTDSLLCSCVILISLHLWRDTGMRCGAREAWGMRAHSYSSFRHSHRTDVKSSCRADKLSPFVASSTPT